MATTKLRFQRYEFPCNPRTLSIKHERNLVQFCSPFAPTIVQDLGIKATIITGEGELYGDDVMGEYERMLTAFSDKNSGLLSIPGVKPIMASFNSLTITARPAPNLLYYSFKFTEV